MKAMKKYVKPDCIVVNVDLTDLLISSCICNNCQCDHNNNSGQGGNNSQAHCNCKNRHKMMIPQEEPMIDWPE
jgi:hypothetical protein